MIEVSRESPPCWFLCHYTIGLNKFYIMIYELLMVEGQGKGSSLTIQVVCELKRLWSRVCALRSLACAASGEVVSLPVRILQRSLRGTKKASSQVFP